MKWGYMMFLHKDWELFKETIYSTATELELPVPVVEKDYYVTMILKELASTTPECVFKGGTSLSKCHHVIDRFSEDIDIAFSNRLTQGERKKLKNEKIAGISQRLEMPISNWNDSRSRRDYNCYNFAYHPIEGYIPESLVEGVKMEVVLSSLSFPTEQLPVDSYVYQFLRKENMDIVEEFGLEPFVMTLQSLDRTLADKVFAICDYYLQGNIQRHSRHIYDIYMLLPKVKQDESFKSLVGEVRKVRADMNMCPSAVAGVNIPEVLREIVSKNVYERDYSSITTYFQNKSVPYEQVISVLETIADSGIFE